MIKRIEEMSRWVPLDDTMPINAETVSRMRMKPGGSNIDVYVDAPLDEMKPKLPTGLSPSRRYEYGKDR